MTEIEVEQPVARVEPEMNEAAAANDDACGHQNEAYEHEESNKKWQQETEASQTTSGSSLEGASNEKYEENETTIEFSSITSHIDEDEASINNINDLGGATGQLARNLANSTIEDPILANNSLFKKQIVKEGALEEANSITIDLGKTGETGGGEDESSSGPKNGFVISWHSLDYVVESKWYKLTSQRKPILNNLSGSFRSGELSAILGPSGAGKSTLMDCLLGKRDRGVTGRTQVTFGSGKVERERRNGKPLRIATIPQEDHLLETLTVTETFMFASRIKNAHLRYADESDINLDHVASSGETLKSTKNKNNNNNGSNRKPFDHFANVQRVIQQLSLSSCAALKCGKLSGGQYKRVSIGQELLSRPDLMILDEPTSGLDSVTCYQTIKALRHLIDSSAYPMAIVATIHQPDIEVFNLFHKAYVLASGGRAIYEGPTDGIFRTVRLSSELVESRRPPGGGPLPVGDSSKSNPLENLKLRAMAGPQSNCNPARLIVEVAAGKYGFEITRAMAELQSRSHQMMMRTISMESPSGTSSGQSSSCSDSTVTTWCGARTGNGELQTDDLKSLVGLWREQYDSILVEPPVFDYHYHDPAHRRPNLDKLLNTNKAQNNNSDNNSIRVYLKHLALHTERSWITIVRDPMLFSLQLALHVLVPLLISYSFMNQIGYDACPRVGPLDVIEEAYSRSNMLDELNQEIRGSFENLGYMFFQLYVIIFAAVCVTSLTYPLVMHVLLKEYRNGWYSMSSYFLGRTLADLPVPTANVIIAMAISYHLTGQPLSAYNWRFASVACLTVLATLVAQTQGLMFGAMLMNLPQSAVFVAPASTAPLVVVSGFLLRIKSLPIPMQLLSQLSYFTHLLNGFIISRYGFNRCPCDEEMFIENREHKIPPQTRSIMDIWVESFGPEYNYTINNNDDNFDSSGSNSTAAAVNGTQWEVNLIGKLVDTVTRAKVFGHGEITDCSQVKPFAMLDYNLNDWDLVTCFAALIIMLFAFRWLTYMVLSWKINSCI